MMAGRWLSRGEVAEALGIAPGTVTWRAARTRAIPEDQRDEYDFPLPVAYVDVPRPAGRRGPRTVRSPRWSQEAVLARKALGRRPHRRHLPNDASGDPDGDLQGETMARDPDKKARSFIARVVLGLDHDPKPSNWSSGSSKAPAQSRRGGGGRARSSADRSAAARRGKGSGPWGGSSSKSKGGGPWG